MLPAGMCGGPKVAFNRGPDTAMPRQLGPTMRPPWARTTSSSRSWRSAPSTPNSANPAEITHKARTPVRSAQLAASSTA